MKLRQPVYTDGEEPLTKGEVDSALRSAGYDPEEVGKKMDVVARQALKIAQLEAELAGMGLMEAEAAQFAKGMELVPEGTQAENERLRDLFRAGHEMDEGRTWFWDDDIVKALGGE